jgi:hypothetical protein
MNSSEYGIDDGLKWRQEFFFGFSQELMMR